MVKTWKTGKLELFDLAKDLSEANDLSGKMPEKTKEEFSDAQAPLQQPQAPAGGKGLAHAAHHAVIARRGWQGPPGQPA